MSVKNDKQMLYSVEITEIYPYSRVWKNWKFTLFPLFKNISSNHIIIVKMLLSQYFCQKSVRLNFNQFHRNSFNKTFFSWKQLLFSNFFSKNVTFTKFLSKLYEERELLVFPHLCNELKKHFYNKSKSVDLTKYS